MDERKVLEDNLRLVLDWDDDELVDLLADDEGGDDEDGEEDGEEDTGFRQCKCGEWISGEGCSWCDYLKECRERQESQPKADDADGEIRLGQYLDHVYENRGDR
jgi:hypothetical protein